ncbi:hypothetical protein [Clostridium sp. B9]|uniref:hypothetical protein n=1 Tax=Clostridium sp. B9 TaxID=3423224 RepID=UPI003D2EDFB0
MLRKFITGSEVIEKSLGYFPSFHDDIIEKVEISKEGIKLYLTLQSHPKNIKSPKIRLKFLHVLS